MINRVVLTGRLTRDVDLKVTGSGISVAQFTLAVDRQFKDKDGKRGADFVSCVIWRKSAENFSKFTHKGTLVGIDGRLQTRTYENKSGQKVYVTEVIVESFTLLDSKKDSGQQSSGYQNNKQNASSLGDTIDITDDDLPF